MGSVPILSVKGSGSIDTKINFDGDGDGDGNRDDTYKLALSRSFRHSVVRINHITQDGYCKPLKPGRIVRAK